jgi:hypothetical protein
LAVKRLPRICTIHWFERIQLLFRRISKWAEYRGRMCVWWREISMLIFPLYHNLFNAPPSPRHVSKLVVVCIETASRYNSRDAFSRKVGCAVFCKFNFARRSWSTLEDDAIRILVSKHGMKNWSVIADEMSSIYNVQGRSAKQCRERWHNHLGSRSIIFFFSPHII